MTDEEFLTAMRIKNDSPERTHLPDADPLTVALRIDDLRSAYCEQLERQISQQALEIELLRRLLGLNDGMRTSEPARSNTSH